MSTAILGVIFLALSGATGFLYTKQKKRLAYMKTLKKMSIADSKTGDVGLFEGEIDGVSIKVPYYDDPVAYYKYELQEEISKKRENGTTAHSWRLVKKGASRAPFMVKSGEVSVLINPVGFAVDDIELYNGKAVGLTKDIFEAIQFITEGNLRPDLMSKRLKLRISGLPIGQKVVVAGKVEQEGGALTIKKTDLLGKLYTATETDDIAKKEKTLVYVFLGLTVILAGLAIAAFVTAI
ncbi:MAG: hypothetical protein ABH826_00775 [Patescibacteria group bacterium]|nr:E3 ubiquitin ligase family protein [Patescibacteria group bacterium]